MEHREWNAFVLSKWTVELFQINIQSINGGGGGGGQSKQSQRNRQEELVNIELWFLESVFLLFIY